LAYSDVILATAGLQSYWRLGESAGTTGAGSVLDSKGSVNGTPTAITFGIGGLLTGDANTAASFPGASSGINYGNNYGFTGTASFSVECWINITSVVGEQHFVDKSWNNGVNREGWDLRIAAGGSLELERWQTNAPVRTPTANILAGTTYYVVGTYDGTNSRLYVNAGAANVSPTDTNAIPATTSSANLGIGGFNGGTFYYVNGIIDEVAIYNVALSSGTISAHYTAGTSPPGYVPPFPGVFNLDARRFI